MARCEICGAEMTQGRGRARRTCSAACRQAAHRRRQADEVAALRTAATATVRPTAPAEPSRNEPARPPDDSPAGRIRDAGAQLARTIEHAALRAEQHWPPNSHPDYMASAVRFDVARVIDAILATAPACSSRDEPTTAVLAPATPGGTAANTGPSRNDPPAKVPARRKRLTQKAAQAVADSAQLVKDPNHRDNHRWNVVAADGTVLGHVVPSYGGASRSGRNGWKYRAADMVVGVGPYKTREGAAVQCTLSWMRAATAPARH